MEIQIDLFFVTYFIYNTFSQLKLTRYDALLGLVSFVLFKKREKHPWSSVTFSTKSNTPSWVLFRFLKLYKRYRIVQRITNIFCDIGFQ